jgi:hypothetical protein
VTRRASGPPPPQPGRTTGDDEWLNLTVWTPDPGRAGLPVVVWISGGYLACDSANPHLAGDALAAAGAVVVSAHYRSGAEGFLRLNGAPDTRGLLDQLAALAWVRDNDAAFGGDPGQRHLVRPVGRRGLDRCTARHAGHGRRVPQRDPAEHPGGLLLPRPRRRHRRRDLRRTRPFRHRR